ncbi:flagellar hook-associated protein FlgK [Paenibacillus thermoaerophilus]|uniref:Flagellar hook-associated protein 1 n=1 Tax=Paenibacillus thermoaerophilus TaxID=1215385 RepID=A0ABW2V706_9BACL|nr:flagellar hook-associated protein FlgK [Paenibacillus thermoaerophilus]TMV12522.1 flagellar hook-associated protein FlgK [Paenibacillus thermoaerophilus]
MRSTFHSLETAKRSLFTHQAALSTTGHNIANANTAGYTRQVVNMVAARPIEAFGMMRSNAPGQLGTGVEFSSITRVREKFLDDQFRNESKSLGNWEVQQDTLEKLEKIMNEPSESGIRTVLDNFWKAWSDLSQNPESITGRKIVRENAKALADALNLTSKQLSDLSADLTENINVKANEMNTKLEAILNLNEQIRRIEGLGDNANDLRDQRDLLTDELSKIVNIRVSENDSGYTIMMGAVELVNGTAYTPVDAAALESAYASGDLNSGEVFGMIVSRDVYVADYQAQLDTMANTIANGELRMKLPEGAVLPDNTVLGVVQADGKTVVPQTFSGAGRTVPAGGLTVVVNGINGLHQLGYNLNSPVEKGVAFFLNDTGGTAVTAANIRLNPVIDGDPSKIATSMRTEGTGTAETVIKGNNALALLMSQVKDSSFDFSSASPGAILQNGTINDFLRSMVGQLGVQSREASRQAGNQHIILEQVDSRRMSVSSVSLDEEMSNMIKFQHAYNAAARNMTAVDEMLDRIINSMGHVGR